MPPPDVRPERSPETRSWPRYAAIVAAACLAAAALVAGYAWFGSVPQEESAAPSLSESQKIDLLAQISASSPETQVPVSERHRLLEQVKATGTPRSETEKMDILRSI